MSVPCRKSPARGRGGRLGLLAVAAVLLVTGCGNGAQGNFSQFPGFPEWRAAYPPSDALPGNAERELLLRYRPRFFLPAAGEGPISFYRDYIASGQLTPSAGGGPVTRQALNAVRLNPAAEFVHRNAGRAPQMALYGRADTAAAVVDGEAPWLYLTYTLVFRSSGLPTGLSGTVGWLLDRVGDIEDWHQLDNYTSVYLALDAEHRPVSATFQQHNYTRTYLLGRAGGPGMLALPGDGRLPVDVAVRSNELYPHRPGRHRRRAISFMDEQGAAYLIGDGGPPLLAADDITDPVREIDPPLCLLPPSDAFYTFRGWLGERRQLPGASGPPGADYNTLPALKPFPVQTVISHWWEGDSFFLESMKDFAPMEATVDGTRRVIAPLARRFASRLAELRARGDPLVTIAGPPPPGACPDGNA